MIAHAVFVVFAPWFIGPSPSRFGLFFCLRLLPELNKNNLTYQRALSYNERRRPPLVNGKQGRKLRTRAWLK